MRRVTLPGSGVTTSALGYGCSSLMARTGRRDSIRLLEEAFDAGITHFDVARLYGYGEAEGALGAFLAGRRDQVTVTTKLGIEPPKRSRGLDLAKAAARRAVAVAPALGRAARNQAGRMVQGGRFGVDQARASLDTSLRELGTDHVDLLLLHECGPEDMTEELLGFLRGCVTDGRAGAFGIATSPDATRAVLAARPEVAATVQIANSVAAPHAQDTPELTGRALITHSALELGLAEIHRHVTGSPEHRARWSAAVGADCADRQVLAELMLTWAITANPDGVVLFSSRNRDRIRANAALSAPEPRRDAADALAALVREELSPRPVPGAA